MKKKSFWTDGIGESYVIRRLTEKRGEFFFLQDAWEKKHGKNVWNKKDYSCKIFSEKQWW